MSEKNEPVEPDTDAKEESESWLAIAKMLRSVVTMLNESADKNGIENYTAITMAWTGALLPSLPFDRVDVAFVRPGGFAPTQKAEIEKVRRQAAEAELSTLRGELEEARGERDEFKQLWETEQSLRLDAEARADIVDAGELLGLSPAVSVQLAAIRLEVEGAYKNALATATARANELQEQADAANRIVRDDYNEMKVLRRDLMRHLLVAEHAADYCDNHHQRSDDPDFSRLEKVVEEWRLEQERLLNEKRADTTTPTRQERSR